MALPGNRVTRYQPTPQEQAQHKKEALAGRVEKQSRVRILEAIRKKLPDALPRPDLEMAVLDYFRRLGHDNHRRLSKVYEWEEKRTKASWGAQNVDYEKIAAAALHLTIRQSRQVTSPLHLQLGAEPLGICAYGWVCCWALHHHSLVLQTISIPGVQTYTHSV